MNSPVKGARAIFFILTLYILMGQAFCVEKNIATITDSSDIHTNLYNLTMSYWGKVYNAYDIWMGNYAWHDSEDILIKRETPN